MAENNYAIEGARTRSDFEDLSSSPPSVEDGFVKFHYRQKEAPPQKERRPSLYDYFTQDGGGALVSMIGGQYSNNNTSIPAERKISRGAISLDQFCGIDFEDFEEAISRPPQVSHVPPLITPVFDTLDHPDTLNDDQAFTSIGESTIQTEVNRSADEALDNAPFQYAQTTKNIPRRKNSIILDSVTSLNINAQQFGNENGNSRKRKISGITNPMLTSEDIHSTIQENFDENSNKSSIHSLGENVDKYGLPNIHTQPTIFEGKTKSLELSNAHVHSTVKHNEVEDDGDKQLVRKPSFIHQDADTAAISQPSFECVSSETSNAHILERKISTSMMNFFTGVLDKSGTSSSIERVHDELEDEGDNQLVGKTSFNHQDVDTAASQSAVGAIRPESSNAKPAMERKISTSVMNFITGVLDKSVTGSSVERAQEVKEINEVNMLFRY